MALLDIIDQSVGLGGFAAMLGLLLLFVLFWWGLRRQRGKMDSGRELGRSAGRRDNGDIRVTLPVHVTQGGQWCRVALDFELVSQSKQGLRGRYKVTQHPFVLTIEGRDGQTIEREQRSLRDFLMMAWSKGGGASWIVGSRQKSTHYQTGLPLLDFIPPHSGEYRVHFSIKASESLHDKSFRFESQLTHAELVVREAVQPLRKRGYPHRSVDLRTR